MQIHELKTWTEYFGMVLAGHKNFELRKNDRDFKLGDELILKEFDPKTNEYSGKILHRRIDYILHGGQFGLEEGYCILSLSKI